MLTRRILNIVEAIAKFPTPSSRTDHRSFVGLTNQFSTFTRNLLEALALLRPLLSTHNFFWWTAVHNSAFEQAKQLIITAHVLAFFDPSKETRIYTDASTLGQGFLLIQRPATGDSEWRIVLAGSRFLTDTESRYAVIELECLVVAWAIKKSNLFLAGLHIVTDHNPLITILN